MQANEELDQPTAQKLLLMFSLAHMLEICGWLQVGVARREKLEPIHVALLRRAVRQRKVSFASIQYETALPLYAISRAAKRLDDRGLARVRLDRADKRCKWLRIAKSGAECIWRIELEIARHVGRHAGTTSNDSKRYYNFTLHVWNATRFFSPSQVITPGFYSPSDIMRSERIRPEQNQIQRFMEDLQQEPVFSPSSPLWSEESETE
jgi:DNA-binding MarR family transcriptional regulator